MSVKDSLERVRQLADADLFPLGVQGEVDDLIEDLEDFFTFVEDYDEWDVIYYFGAESPGPGFRLEKLREALGFDEEGN